MSEFIGARISLISKSDIRYSGTLHNISSEDSTVSLENVSSFGTEDRRTGDDFIAPSEQVYEYIVFRGSDVKDLRIEDAPVPKAMPPAMPNDPAIVGARPRPVNNASQFQQGPPQGIPPQGGPGFHPNMPIPPGPGGWGPNGPGPRNFPYPPPAGWYPPQGPGFGPGGPAGSGGPGGPQWNNNFYPPGPPFAPGPPGPGRPQQGGPGPMGGPEVGPGQPGGPSELEPKSLGQPPLAAPNKPAAASGASAASAASAAPAAAGPSADRPAAPPASASAAASAPAPAPVPAATRPPAPSARTTDAPAPATAGGEDASLMAATAAAKAAVANAMSKVNPTSQQAPATRGGPAAPVDNLTQKFNEMRVNATRDPNQPPHHHNHHNNNNSSHYGSRGRGRGGSYGNGPRRTHNPVPVPNTAFDFEASNQKFNKEDVVKEVIASGDVDAVVPAGPSGAESESALGGPGGEADTAEAPVAYSKTRSFFDNISSEAKDRAANAGQKPGSREWRGEEQRKNMETFGQGSVDGNHRGYRGRGRGRGRGYGRGRGNGGYRQNNYNKAD